MIRHRTTADIRQLDRLKFAVVLGLLGVLVILFWSAASGSPAAAPLSPAPTATPTLPVLSDSTRTATATAAALATLEPTPSPVATSTAPQPPPTLTPGAPAPTAAPAQPETATPQPTECIGPKGVLQGNRYIVGECDTLAQISRLAGVSLPDLIAANPEIPDPDLIFPGQVVILPRRP